MSQNSLVEKAEKVYGVYTNALSYLGSPLLLGMRLYWGWQFFLTGKGKLMNLDRTAEFFASLNIPAPKLNAMAAGSVECFGGMLLILGLGSRLISVPLASTMVVAYLTAHIDEVKHIFTNPDGVITAPPFLFLATALIVLAFGGGFFSLDTLIAKLVNKSNTPPTTSNTTINSSQIAVVKSLV